MNFTCSEVEHKDDSHLEHVEHAGDLSTAHLTRACMDQVDHPFDKSPISMCPEALACPEDSNICAYLADR